MTTILDEILERKREEVAAAKGRVSPEALAEQAQAVTTPPRGFERALRETPAPRVIAELKRRSPSKGEIRAEFDPAKLAQAYVQGGAAALSVLTDEHYFGGSLEILRSVRACVDLPILRKDFTVDAYQIDEARVAGADAILLIAKALGPDELRGLHGYALNRGLDVLVEVNNEEEVEVAIGAGASVIGVNNRDLRRFVTDLAVTERLAPRMPKDSVLVSESGIVDFQDVSRLSLVGAHAFLVGESLMRETDVTKALQSLRGID